MFLLPKIPQPGEYILCVVVEVSGISATTSSGKHLTDEKWVDIYTVGVLPHHKIEAHLSKAIQDVIPITQEILQRDSEEATINQGNLRLQGFAPSADNYAILLVFTKYAEAKETLSNGTYEAYEAYSQITTQLVSLLRHTEKPLLDLHLPFSKEMPAPKTFLQNIRSAGGRWGSGKSRP